MSASILRTFPGHAAKLGTVITCQRCGQLNEPGRTQCSNPECRASLTRRPTIRATLSPPYAEVLVGKTVEVIVEVRNDNTEVEELALGIQGRLGEFGSISPAHLSLFPGQEAQVRVSFTLTKGDNTPSGPMPYGITVTSWVTADLATLVFGVVTVAEATTPTIRLQPVEQSGWRSAYFRVEIGNAGDSTLEGQIIASDSDQSLRFDIEPRNVSVQPGGSATVHLRARSHHLRWWGRALPHPFWVLLQPRGDDAVRVDGVMKQRAVVSVPASSRESG